MKSPKLLSILVLLVALPSCATKFTAAQRSALSTVAIAPTVVNSDAYAEPYGGDRQAAGQAGMVGVTSQTGAIGGAVGSLVGEAIAGTQDQVFRSKHKGSFAAVQANTPQVGPLFHAKLDSAIKAEPFFKSKVRPTSPNFITSTITSYKLTRMGKGEGGELLLAPQITVQMDLKDASGKSLAKGNYVGSGYLQPISVYATNASKSKEGYEFAAKMAVDQFTAMLAKKAAD